MQVAKVDVPPPAPSPPQSHPPPVNVFDFLVSERSPATSDASAPSSPASPIYRRPSVSSVSSSESSRPPTRSSARHQHKSSDVTYGSDPITRSLHKYASDVSLPMDFDSQASQAAAAAHTPAPRQIHHAKNGTQTGSEKKRKRPPVEELDLSDAKNSEELSDSHAGLHTGLTGGLGKLLEGSDAKRDVASPLSPKKRSRLGADRETDSRSTKQRSEARSERHELRKKHKHRRQHESARVRRPAIEAPATPKAIAAAPAKRSSFQSHSEFFLSLVDKDHKSRRGQSIWGALKTFHDGLCDADELDVYEQNGQKLREEKRLLKALRVKRNKEGEIVLFARPDYELAEEMESVKRIEAP